MITLILYVEGDPWKVRFSLDSLDAELRTVYAPFEGKVVTIEDGTVKEFTS